MTRCWVFLPALCLCACAASGPTNQAETEKTPHIVWPQAPEIARIEFVTQIIGPEDLGLRESFLKRTRDILAGSEDQRLSRPYAIATNGDLVVVADPGSATVHVFDKQRRRYRQLVNAGEHRFSSPIGVAIGGNRLFIADAGLQKVFALDQRFKVLFTLEGYARPTGLAFDQTHQRLYVTDTPAHQIKAYGPGGKPLFSIGERGEHDAQFNYPSHLAFSGDRLYVNDTLNFRIQVFDADGQHLKTFGKHGGSSGHLAQSKGLAVDSDGHIYVADALSNQVQIFDQNGAFLLGIGAEGTGPGKFRMPAGLAIWKDSIYVADSHNRRVQVFRYLPEVQ